LGNIYRERSLFEVECVQQKIQCVPPNICKIKLIIILFLTINAKNGIVFFIFLPPKIEIYLVIKNQNSMLKQYETVFIMTPVLSDDQMKETVKKFENFLRDKGAEIIHQENWGLKRLEYQIQKKSTGFYHLFEFKAEPHVVAEFELQYRRDERVLRYLTVTLDKDAIAYAEKRRTHNFGQKKEPKSEIPFEVKREPKREIKYAPTEEQIVEPVVKPIVEQIMESVEESVIEKIFEQTIENKEE
jgi:small subunit ribosomal protein S6